jgi:hypothetical protein
MSLNSEDELILNTSDMSKSSENIVLFSFPKIMLILLAAMSVAISCKKPGGDLPPEPQIEFLSFKTQGDTGIMTIKFQDGDGNIGLGTGDTLGDFHFSKPFYNNLFFEYYEKDDFNGWQPGLDVNGNHIIYKYRVPFLTPNGKDKHLTGEIEITMEPRYFNPTSSNSDSLKFIIYLYDRSLNKSNEVETPEIIREI